MKFFVKGVWWGQGIQRQAYFADFSAALAQANILLNTLDEFTPNCEVSVTAVGEGEDWKRKGQGWRYVGKPENRHYIDGERILAWVGNLQNGWIRK